MRAKISILVVVIAVAAACASHGVSREVNGVKIVEDKVGLWARATFAPDSAIKIALARVPGGTISGAELEEEGGRVMKTPVRVSGRDSDKVPRKPKTEGRMTVDAMAATVMLKEYLLR